MASLTLVRKSTIYNPELYTYTLRLEITSAENITKAVFVKQRLRNFTTNTFDDVFAAIASVAQLEDLDEDSPKTGDSYFRDKVVELVGTDITYLETVYDSIVDELQNLVIESEAQANLNTDRTSVITAATITIS